MKNSSSSKSSAKASGGGKSSKGKSGKSSNKGNTSSVPNPSSPEYDTHPGAHDTKSSPNETLNESGTIKMGHKHPKFDGEELSKRGADKELAKLYARKSKPTLNKKK